MLTEIFSYVVFQQEKLMCFGDCRPLTHSYWFISIDFLLTPVKSNFFSPIFSGLDVKAEKNPKAPNFLSKSNITKFLLCTNRLNKTREKIKTKRKKERTKILLTQQSLLVNLSPKVLLPGSKSFVEILLLIEIIPHISAVSV